MNPVINSRLAAALGDRWIAPGDASYDMARQIFNGAINRRPVGIAECQTTDDVLRVLEIAHANQAKVCVRSSGHNVAGRCVQDNAIVIDLGRMKRVQMSPGAKVARVQSGVNWGELDASTQAFGLAVTGGTVPSTGVPGLTLGGGVGWLLPSHGLSCDNLRAAKILTTGGGLYETSDLESPDIIWALRGGGYGLGVVVEMEFDLHHVGAIYGGALIFQIDDAYALLDSLASRWERFPRSVMLSPALLWIKGQPVLELDIAVNGPPSDWSQVEQWFPAHCKPVASTMQLRSYCDMQKLLENPFRRGLGAYWKSGFVKALSQGVVSVLIDAIKAAPNEKCLIMIEHYHGAYLSGLADRSAYPHRGQSLNVLLVSSWSSTEGKSAENAARDWAGAAFGLLKESLSGAEYCNYLSDEVRLELNASESRLASIRTLLDPSSLLAHGS